MTKLDYSLQTPEERKKLVEKILAETPDPSPQYLEILADYLVLCMEKQEKKEKKLLTDNRLTTVNKRETSLEGLTSQLENGENGLYNLISETSKYTLLQPKISITKEDLEEIPFLKQVREAIELLEVKLKTASGKDAFIIKKTIIDLRKDQYIIKNAYRKPVNIMHSFNPKFYIELDEDINVDSNGDITYTGITLLNPKVVLALMNNYSKLRQDFWGNFDSDIWFMMEDFDHLSTIALESYPLYQRILEYKIDGMQNAQIQKKLYAEFGIHHSLEYLSNLWTKKIPKLIASTAEDQYLDWYYLNKERGKYKHCSRCGELKLAHHKYFSKNKTSKDGWYSICKACRNIKDKKV